MALFAWFTAPSAFRDVLITSWGVSRFLPRCLTPSSLILALSLTFSLARAVLTEPMSWLKFVPTIASSHRWRCFNPGLWQHNRSVKTKSIIQAELAVLVAVFIPMILTYLTTFWRTHRLPAHKGFSLTIPHIARSIGHYFASSALRAANSRCEQQFQRIHNKISSLRQRGEDPTRTQAGVRKLAENLNQLLRLIPHILAHCAADKRITSFTG